MSKKIVVAVTGASGAIYARSLLSKIRSIGSEVTNVGLVFTKNAKTVWELELGDKSYEDYDYTTYEVNDYFAPFASGSAKYDAMVIVPCSMGTMGRIATGVSDSLIVRAADVMLKERRKLILVVRDTPYGLIQINNMKTITEAGGIICPASPSFYSKPKNFDELAATVTDRVIDLIGLDIDSYRWQED